MGFLDFLKKKALASKEQALQKNSRLIEWQNLILQENHSELILSEQQLNELSRQQAENDLRIIKDCARLVETTVKPEVFFMRLRLLWEKAEHLCRLEPYMSFSGSSPSAAFLEIRNNHQIAIKQFLIRYFSDTYDKAEALKTAKGRIAKYQKFYDSLQEYYWIMDSENIDYIETKYRVYTKKE